MSPFRRLHPHRVEVLHALALVAAGREPLADGLARVAADDPLLRPWARRLGPPLARGEALAPTLRRAGLIDADQAGRIAVADGDVLPIALRRCADEASDPIRGVGLVRWFPFWLGAAMAWPGVGMVLLLRLLGFDARDLFATLGIAAPQLVPHVASPTGELLLWALALPLAFVAVHLGIAAVPGVRHLAWLWQPSTYPAVALARLLRSGRILDRAGDEPAVAAELLVGLGDRGVRETRRWRWRRDWGSWWAASWFRLDPVTRERTRNQEDLAERLRTAGVLGIDGRGAPDWDAAEAVARRRLRAAAVADRPVLVAVLALTALAGLVALLSGPTLRVTEVMGSGDIDLSMGMPAAAAPWAKSTVAAVARAAIRVSMPIVIPLLAAVALQWLWLWVLTAGRADHAARRQLAAALAEVLRAGGSAAQALRAAAALARVPDCWAMQRAADALAGPDPELIGELTASGAMTAGEAQAARAWQAPDLITALADQGLMSADEAASARAAGQLGRGALAEWFAAHGTALRPGLALAPYLGVAAVQALVIGFLMVVVAPRWEVIAKDLGVQLPRIAEAGIDVARAVGEWWWAGALLLLGVALPAWLVLSARWRRRAPWLAGSGRRERALLLLAGWSRGVGEAGLADLVASAWPSAPSALRQAGERGDFAGLCHVCGWNAATPPALAAALAGQERRRDRRRAVLALTTRVAMPVLLALPVLWIGAAAFTTYAWLLRRLAEVAS